MTASNHEILTAVSIARGMGIDGMIVSAGYRIPKIRSSDGVRSAVIGVVRPLIVVASDADLVRWAREAGQALNEALDVESTPAGDCDCWHDCGHGQEVDELKFVSDWLDMLSEELTAECDLRGICLFDIEEEMT